MTKKMRSKKRKKHVPVYLNKAVAQLGKAIEFDNMKSSETAQQAQEPQRASVSSYVFIAGNRTLIRNLSDEFLNNQYESIITESNEMRRQLSLLESLQFNMSMEQRFRGLK